MFITINVPDTATKLFYAELNQDGWETEPQTITMGRIVRVEQEAEDERSPES